MKKRLRAITFIAVTVTFCTIGFAIVWTEVFGTESAEEVFKTEQAEPPSGEEEEEQEEKTEGYVGDIPVDIEVEDVKLSQDASRESEWVRENGGQAASFSIYEEVAGMTDEELKEFMDQNPEYAFLDKDTFMDIGVGDGGGMYGAGGDRVFIEGMSELLLDIPIGDFRQVVEQLSSALKKVAGKQEGYIVVPGSLISKKGEVTCLLSVEDVCYAVRMQGIDNGYDITVEEKNK